MDIRENMIVVQFEKARNNNIQGSYKYLIKDKGYKSYMAYKTNKGFNFFLKSRNLQLELIEERYSKDLGKIKEYKIIGTIQEKMFWSMKEIPKETKTFKGLSNGKLVDCFYQHVNNGSIIYKPNPNAKEVYKPMPINEHVKFQALYG